MLLGSWGPTLLAIQFILAGFVLFPALIGFYSWERLRVDATWLLMLGWSAAVSLYMITGAEIQRVTTSPERRIVLSEIHFTAGGAGALLMLLVMFGVLRQSAWISFTVAAVLTAASCYLFAATDLFWDGQFTETGDQAGSTSLRSAFYLTSIAAIMICFLSAWSRSPRSVFSKRTVFAAIAASAAIGVLGKLLPYPVGFYIATYIFVPPLVIVQLLYFGRFRRQYLRVRDVAERERKLSEFGARAMAENATSPIPAAVTLLAEGLQAQACCYVPFDDGGVERGDRTIPAPMPGLAAGSALLASKVEVAGRVVGELRAQVLADDSEDAGFVSSVAVVLSAAMGRADIEAQLRRQSLHDDLTGLPNWALLTDRIDQMLESREHDQVSVLYCDISDLHGTNHELGHHAGDAVLVEFARRVSKLFPAPATVARVAGDEFAVLCAVDNESQAAEFGESLLALAVEPVVVAGGRISFGVRIGVACGRPAQAGPTTRDDLIRDAQFGVMRAKETGSRVTAYSDDLRTRFLDHRALVRDLRIAIEQEQIYPEYQPIVNMHDGSIHAVEALARWNHPERGHIGPAEFVPAAEAAGLMVSFGELMMSSAIRQLAQWDLQDPRLRSLRMALNVAPIQLLSRDFPQRVRALLKANDIDPGRVTIEITEETIESEPAEIVKRLAQLRGYGLSISLDDFGTGYSTMRRLMELPVTELKIDQSFVSDLDGNGGKIVRALLGLASGFDLLVVAEGIETQDQWKRLHRGGCQFGQGFLFDRSLSAEELPARFFQSRRKEGNGPVPLPRSQQAWQS